jgi:hypothetical protein
MNKKHLAILAVLNALVSVAVACAAQSNEDDTSNDNLTAADVMARAKTFHTTPADRIGRPAISAVVLNMEATVDEKDSERIDHVKWFDELDSFSNSDLEGSKEQKVVEKITTGMKLMDHSDGKDDFTDEQVSQWVTLFKEDALVVDISKPCGVVPESGPSNDTTHSYLDIEKEAVDHDHAHTTCGGRTPKDDTVDVFMTFSIAHRDWHPGMRDWKNTPEHMGDLIDNASDATNNFPYLATPHALSLPSSPIPDSVDFGTGRFVAGDFSQLVEESAKANLGETLKEIWKRVLNGLGIAS